jgi:hypothetical protein
LVLAGTGNQFFGGTFHIKKYCTELEKAGRLGMDKNYLPKISFIIS